MAQKKLYPFSAAKHAHDIELVANRTYNLAQDALQDNRYDDYDKLMGQHEIADEVSLAIQSGMINHKVAMLDGKTLAKAKELINNASAIRDGLAYQYNESSKEEHNEKDRAEPKRVVLAEDISTAGQLAEALNKLPSNTKLFPFGSSDAKLIYDPKDNTVYLDEDFSFFEDDYDYDDYDEDEYSRGR